ncbi:hypothetical protein [Azospirillum sp.]|uniref:hypothetical protein n=1 Tax=Azospirillum sp. TaxID=34012 RepID=UPI002D482D44|nr:hypothetical protein [Azospirillum sp.]HYD66229.1 hypothetical protein [Azospirillum sp.]
MPAIVLYGTAFLDGPPQATRQATMKRQYTRAEVKELLSALERQCRQAAKLAQTAEHEASKHSFGAYREFRDKVGEFQALVILIEQRLRNLADARSDDLREQFERLDTVMLALLVRASMRFFFVLSANPILPMGAREIFMSELRSLHDAAEKLRRPQYVTKLGPELEKDLETASLILEEIIDKAPSLLNFRGGEG